MFVISFANPKGGSGKTTSAMLIAEQLYHAGAKVAVLDCDPNQNIIGWAKMREQAGKSLPFNVQGITQENELLEAVDLLENEVDYLVIDLEGTANQIVTYAASRSDLVLIPFEPTPMEARQAARAVQLMRQTGKMLGRAVEHALLFTRVNAAMQTSDEKDVRKDTLDIPALKTAIVRRSAYTRIFREGAMLSELLAEAKASVEGKSNSQQERVLKPLLSAIKNAKEFAQEAVNHKQNQEAAA